MADRDKTASAGAIHDKIAEEVVEFLAEQPIEATLDTVDPFIELVVLAADRIDEETDEDTIDKIARSEAVHDNTAGERVGERTADRVNEEAIEIIVIDPVTETIVDKITEEVAEFLVEQPTEAAVDNTIDPYIELAVLAAELAVDTSIEAILVAEERGDEFSVDPLIEAIQAAKRLTKKLRDPGSNPASSH